jgi:oligopeptidase B
VAVPGHEPEDYELLTIEVTAADGARVPVTMARRKERPLADAAVVEVYGAYGRSVPLDFDLARVPLLRRGIVWAVAHVRGGGEGGTAWAHAGRRTAKAVGITDYVACLRALAERAGVSRVVGRGTSAGALIVAAAANRVPSSFAGILIDVPFLDPLGSLLDPAVPLTTLEWNEWGDPGSDPSVYAAMMEYAPYDNIPETFPSAFAIAGLCDSRVGPHEAVAWIARLRTQTSWGGPFLLWTDMAAGHGGPTDRGTRLRNQGMMDAWSLHVLGHADPSR